jgi:hypothetical protein
LWQKKVKPKYMHKKMCGKMWKLDSMIPLVGRKSSIKIFICKGGNLSWIRVI